MEASMKTEDRRLRIEDGREGEKCPLYVLRGPRKWPGCRWWGRREQRFDRAIGYPGHSPRQSGAYFFFTLGARAAFEILGTVPSVSCPESAYF